MDDNSRADFEEGAVGDRVRELCRRGLDKFRQGDVAGALLDWDRARMLDTDAFLPRSYIERAAHGLDPESGEIPSGLTLPLGAPPDSGESPAVRVPAPPSDEDDEDDDYLELELTSGDPEPHHTVDTVDLAKRRFLDTALDVFQLDDLDAGWTLEPELGKALPPPPAQARAPSSDLGAVPAGIMGVPEDALAQTDDVEPDVDDLPAPPARLGGETLDMAADSDEYREISTRELARPGVGARAPAGHAIHDSDSEITVPGGATGEVEEAGGMSLSDDALLALGGVAEPSSGDDPTVERPGVVKRGLALPDLDDLFGETRRDDRHDTESDHQVTFREGTEDGLDQELTTERPSFRSGSHEFGGEIGSLGGLDEELTTERPAMNAGDQGIELPALDELFDPPENASGSPAVIVEPGLLDGMVDDEPGFIHAPAEPGAPDPVGLAPSSGDWESVYESIRSQVSDALPEAASEDERVGNWVSAFIDRARLEADRQRADLAVTALELALGEQPDSIVAQKLIHRHRDLLIEIYQSYLGDGSRVPMLAVPMHELRAETLESRGVFLLSRIDGTFTVEEILDVSGMSDIEAYRHLCKLALKGILELR